MHFPDDIPFPEDTIHAMILRVQGVLERDYPEPMATGYERYREAANYVGRAWRLLEDEGAPFDDPEVMRRRAERIAIEQLGPPRNR